MTAFRDGTKWPSCTPCGTTWRQSGNRTGHCSQCHRTFQGLTAFDRHQNSVDGHVTCSDPGPMVRAGTDEQVFDLTIGDGNHDTGVEYWSIHVTDEARAAFKALNEKRKEDR